MGAPTVSASMATAVLAYSGIAVKMLVDQRLDAQLHTMFMVDYQPGAVAHPHDHPFEESYYMLEGEVDVVADGDRYTLRPGDVFWTGVGCVHAFYETQGGRCAGSRPRRPGRRRGTRTGTSATGTTSPSGSRSKSERVSDVSDEPRRACSTTSSCTRGLYRQMLLIRGFEELVQSLFLQGEVYGTTHLYSGQEAVATGVASVLEERDRVAATYRGHGHALALGVDPQALLDEMLGRATGINGGRAGSMNVTSPADRLIGSFGIVGGSIAAATGAALALQAHHRRRRGRVLRRRRDEPGLLLRVPQLRAGAAAAARPRLREQRLRRVHAVPVGHGRRDPRARRGDGGARRDDRRDERLDRARGRGARRSLMRAPATGRSSSRRSPTASSATRAAIPAPTGPRASSTAGASAIPIVVLRAQLEEEGVDAAELDELEREVTESSSACASAASPRPFPSRADVREFKD